MLSLGNIRPASLRNIEALIWKDLVLVSEQRLTAQEMIDHILDNIIDPETLASFNCMNKPLHSYLWSKFDPLKDHLSFFFPGNTVSLIAYFCSNYAIF